MSDNLVPEPQASVFDSVSKVLGDEEAARRVMANPQLAAGFPNGHPAPKSDGGVEMCACGRHPKSECEDGEHSSEDDIPLKAIDDIGRATAEDVKEALLEADIEWFSFYGVRGIGKSREARVYRGVMYDTSSIERMLISVVVREKNVEKTVQAILKSAYTGEIGDGRIFVIPIEDAVRIRTGERGDIALYNAEKEK